MSLHRPTRTVILFSVFLLVAMIGLGTMVGCGVKAAPRPPQPQPLSAIQDLTAASSERGKSTIILTWHSTPDHAAIVAFEIYASRTDLAQAPCAGCPEMFEKIDRLVVAHPLDTGHLHEFSFTAQAGMRYGFKVVALMPGGARGPDSNVAVIEIQQ